MVPGEPGRPRRPYGDFYVWSDTDEGYPDARIIFVDTEVSNWTFDPVRRQFFWHRFFAHQPDLNFENPAVQEAMFDIVRFWMDLGIDGFRLDAVPYLFEEEGTNCENLPRTHEFLARVQAMVDEEYPGRILLAEANQPPAEVVDYYGTEEAPECHMCFHFPVMPRLYYALREEKAAPIVSVLAETPPIPPGTQWGTFLRNHDELTLEMVSPEERTRHVRLVRAGPTHAGQRRHPASAGAPARQLTTGDRAHPRAHPLAPRIALPLLRRRDRDGRQHLAHRPRRRAHPDAVDARPQLGLLDGRPGQALPAGHLEPRLPLQQRQRRGADGHLGVTAALDPRHAPGAKPASGLRARRLRGGQRRQRDHPGVHPVDGR